MLSVQKGLLGEVGSNLRAVRVRIDEEAIHLSSFFDGPPSEEDRESMSCVETQVIADLPDNITVTMAVNQCDYPLPLPKEGYGAFIRRE